MKKKKKAEEAFLRQDLQRQVEAIKPTATENHVNTRDLKALQQFDDGTDVGSIDILKPNLQIYNRAIANQQNERTDNGILGTLGRGDNAGAQNYKTYMNYKRQQDAAGGLENAYNAARGQLEDRTFNYSQLANSRNLGKASAGQNAYRTFVSGKGPGILQQATGWLNFGKNIAGAAFGA